MFLPPPICIAPPYLEDPPSNKQLYRKSVENEFTFIY